jgi:UDP-N-acetylglucosamine diphosphorylase / glucose-1-phosphate thymidylyltransferase / UDP-N-acetylgalactosamine diphosphorylase / glucosamine-1-phosphate N-acetyltransferase / galactosamine-1-phosphate N-acetyltransferase
MTALPPLFAEVPEPFRAAYDPEAPWALLGDPLDELLDELPDRHFAIAVRDGVFVEGDRVVVGEGTEIAPGALLQGPVWIGSNVEIRTGAYIRGGCWIGDGSVVGANTEVKRSILFPGAKAPHLAYVGDSILGPGVNLGAGTILSNFRHDGGEVVILGPGGRKIRTGRRKLGAVLGDGVATGCNTVLHPGVVMGRESMTYPGVMLRSGVYPERSILKLRQQIQVLERRD